MLLANEDGRRRSVGLLGDPFANDEVPHPEDVPHCDGELGGDGAVDESPYRVRLKATPERRGRNAGPDDGADQHTQGVLPHG